MQNDLPVSWTDIHVVAKKLSNTLRVSGKSWDKIIAVTRGGMVPACLVARDLDIRIIDTVSIESYNHQNQGSSKVRKLPDSIGEGEMCLIIDDLSDTGNTFRVLRELFPKATYGCLYVKPQGKPLADFYAEETVQDCWIYFPWEDQDFPPHIKEKIGSHL